MSKIFNVKKWIKNNYKPIIFLILFAIIVNINVPYYIYNGGGTINVSKRIKIDNNNKNSNINLTYVSQLKGNIASLLVSYIIPGMEREKITNSIYTPSEEEIIGKLELKDSLNNATISSYNLLNKKYNIFNDKVIVIYIDEKSKTDLKIGDQINKVNKKTINTINDYVEIIKNSNIGDVLKLDVINNGKRYKKTIQVKTIESKKMTGISIMNSYDLNTDPKIEIKTDKNEFGPSAGLMTSIAIYDKLSKKDIIKNRIICGTGTIDSEGIVGEIAGVKHKLKGAIESKCDIFLTPTKNLKETLKEKDKNKYKIKIVEAKNLNQVIESLLKTS